MDFPYYEVDNDGRPCRRSYNPLSDHYDDEYSPARPIMPQPSRSEDQESSDVLSHLSAAHHPRSKFPTVSVPTGTSITATRSIRHPHHPSVLKRENIVARVNVTIAELEYELEKFKTEVARIFASMDDCFNEAEKERQERQEPGADAEQ